MVVLQLSQLNLLDNAVTGPLADSWGSLTQVCLQYWHWQFRLQRRMCHRALATWLERCRAPWDTSMLVCSQALHVESLASGVTYPWSPT